MTICIPPELIEKVKKVVTEPSSISRDKQLTDLFGSKETAKEINTLYEKSLLLKNQKTAIDKFVDNFTELGQKAKADIKEKIRVRLEGRTEKIQNDELLAIAQDIFNKKYKLDVDLVDVEKLNALKREADNLKSQMEAGPRRAPGETATETELAYGRKQIELKNAIGDLKNPNENLGLFGTAKVIAKRTADRFTKENGITGNIGEAFSVVGEAATSAILKSIQASADLSYSLRQGFKVLTKNPAVWKENWVEAFKPFKNITDKKAQQAVADEFNARLVSHPLFDKAVDSKLALGVLEDFFPTTLADRIPALGNIFKASNEAFSIFSQGSRMGLFEDMYNKALQKGVEMTPELEKSIAQVANSITGRGSLGSWESVSGNINKIFYSGRYIRSALDTFAMPFNPKLDEFARKEAMKSSVATLGTIAALMYTASLFTDVEFNPQSSKFGKFKVPGTKDRWVDLTAGIGSYITVASKLATGKSKSATTGKISKINERDKKGNLTYGGQTYFDVGLDFLTNKLAPAPSAIAQIAKGRDYSGKKPTVGSTALNLVTPIAAGNMFQAFASDDDTAAATISSIFDILGLNQTDYTQFKKKK